MSMEMWLVPASYQISRDATESPLFQALLKGLYEHSNLVMQSPHDRVTLMACLCSHIKTEYLTLHGDSDSKCTYNTALHFEHRKAAEQLK